MPLLTAQAIVPASPLGYTVRFQPPTADKINKLRGPGLSSHTPVSEMMKRYWGHRKPPVLSETGEQGRIRRARLAREVDEAGLGVLRLEILLEVLQDEKRVPRPQVEVRFRSLGWQKAPSSASGTHARCEPAPSLSHLHDDSAGLIEGGRSHLRKLPAQRFKGRPRLSVHLAHGHGSLNE